LETVALIASSLSAFAAVTTSLRALGKSREYSRYEQNMLKSVLLMYRVTTVKWFFLSFFFISPFLIKKWMAGEGVWFFIWLLAYIVLSPLLWFIWSRVSNKAESKE